MRFAPQSLKPLKPLKPLGIPSHHPIYDAFVRQLGRRGVAQKKDETGEPASSNVDVPGLHRNGACPSLWSVPTNGRTYR